MIAAEQEMATTIRAFIVASVGEDLGAGMTQQADDLTDLLLPALAQAWDEGYNSRWDNSVITRSIENPYRQERSDARDD